MHSLESVAKFGGSSMAQPEVPIGIVGGNPEQWPCVVVSAVGKYAGQPDKVTDLLIAAGNLTTNPDFDEVRLMSMLDDVVSIYDERYDSLGWRERSILNNWLHSTLMQYRLRSEQLPGIGEVASAVYGATGAQAKAFVSTQVADANKLDSIGNIVNVETDSSRFPLVVDNSGRIVHRLTLERIEQMRTENPNGRQLWIPGFIAFDNIGNLHTLPRGGSDRTGGMLAQGYGLPYSNFTDVDGVYALQPGIIDNLEPVDRIDYAEQRESANLGSGVLQGDTMIDMQIMAELQSGRGVPAKRHDTHVINTFKPDESGTIVMDGREIEDNERDVRLISSQNLGMIAIHDPVAASGLGWLERIAKTLGDRGLNIETITTGKDDITIGVNNPLEEAEMIKLLAEPTIKGNSELSYARFLGLKAQVSLIGLRLSNPDTNSNVSRSIHGILNTAGIRYDAPSHHPGTPSISIPVEPGDAERAQELLYKVFIERQNKT